MKERAFGEFIRSLRERRLKTDRRFSLRQFAAMVGVSPTYLSRIERGDFPPPAEERIVDIANALGESPDRLLALAGKVPSDLSQIILRRPELIADFLRKADKVGEKGLKKILRKIDDGSW
jgi:HTH-type transcriptional regulator, competence development regulator